MGRKKPCNDWKNILRAPVPLRLRVHPATKLLDTPVGRPPNFQYLNLYNSAADCSIPIKFVVAFYQVTADTLQVFEFKESKVKVTA